MNFFDYNATLNDSVTFEDYKGVNSYRIVYDKTQDVSVYKILPTQQFRPDKICSDLYDDPSLTWVLDDLNNFKHGIKEYKADTAILVFKRETLVRNGIINR
jgi:hypothetical protein